MQFLFSSFSNWGSSGQLYLIFCLLVVQCVILFTYRRENRSHKALAKSIKKAERNAALTKSLLENLPEAICFKDTEGRIVDANSVFVKGAGAASKNEVIGKTDQDIKSAPPDNSRAEAEQRQIQSGKTIRACELKKGIDGKTCHIESIKIPFCNSAEEIIGLLEISRDITKQVQDKSILQKAEKEAEHSAALLQALFENLPDHIYYKDRKSRILGMNPACFKHLGASVESDVIGKTDIDLHPAPLGRQLYDNEQRQMETGETTRVRERHERPDGSISYVESIKSPFRDQTGVIIGLVGITRDITNQVQNEKELITAQQEAESANKAKSAFLAMMSHEIRTPMNGVIGAASLLMGTKLSDFQEEFVHTIEVSGENLMTIINDILDYSKIEAGKIELESVPFVLRECIENAFDLFVQAASKKNLELLYHVEPDVPKILLGDPTRMRQIIVNLLGNAIKFTEEGEISIQVHMLSLNETSNRCQLRFSVRDSGIGISAEAQKKLFQSFTQADASSTRKYGGTGLGLAISRRLTELMGGSIWIDSEEGKGSTFYFTAELPIGSAGQKQPIDLHPDALRDKRVLIVDDNQTNRTILSTQLKQWGAIPTTFAHPEKVVAHLLETRPYDIALLDYQMPIMNGAKLARAIQKIPDYPKPPIIILSSSYESIPQHSSIDARMPKPIKINKLYDLMLQLLGEVSVLEQTTDKNTRIRSKKSTSLRILVAEDNPINQRVAQMMLQRLGYSKTVYVEDGQEAIAAVMDTEYDIVLMDVQMPHMNGLEATRAIRKYTGEENTPWVIALTAGVMEEERKKIIDSGMNEFLPKPLRVEQLEEKLDAASERLKQRQLQRRPINTRQHSASAKQ